MDLYTTIVGLYSQNRHEVLRVVNTAIHNDNFFTVKIAFYFKTTKIKSIIFSKSTINLFDNSIVQPTEKA